MSSEDFAPPEKSPFHFLELALDIDTLSEQGDVMAEIFEVRTTFDPEETIEGEATARISGKPFDFDMTGELPKASMEITETGIDKLLWQVQALSGYRSNYDGSDYGLETTIAETHSTRDEVTSGPPGFASSPRDSDYAIPTVAIAEAEDDGLDVRQDGHELWVGNPSEQVELKLKQNHRSIEYRTLYPDEIAHFELDDLEPGLYTVVAEFEDGVVQRNFVYDEVAASETPSHIDDETVTFAIPLGDVTETVTVPVPPHGNNPDVVDEFIEDTGGGAIQNTPGADVQLVPQGELPDHLFPGSETITTDDGLFTVVADEQIQRAESDYNSRRKRGHVVHAIRAIPYIIVGLGVHFIFEVGGTSPFVPNGVFFNEIPQLAWFVVLGIKYFISAKNVEEQYIRPPH